MCLGAPIEALIDRIAELYGFHHLIVGDILKDEIILGTGRSELANKLLDRGVVIPRRYLNEMIKQRMSHVIKHKDAKGFIFSDFPTNFAQAMIFTKTVLIILFMWSE